MVGFVPSTVPVKHCRYDDRRFKIGGFNG